MSEFIKQKQVAGLVSALAAKAQDSAVVKKANNLSDVNAAAARTNLGVYSKAEVEGLVAGADNAHSVATLTARNALSGLKVSDRVFVANDGDDKWALYIVTAVTNGSGSTSTFTKVADEDLFSNALTKEAVKTAYESNSNTNAFTDSDKTKVARLTISQAINLDNLEDDLADTMTAVVTAQNTANSASSAASTAQSTANTARSEAAAAQNTANGAVADAADAQTTANTAVSDAAAAQSAANAAQSTANSAATAAAAAQSTANTARTEAAAAQSTANNALSAANARELAFEELSEDFTGLTGDANATISVSLSQSIASGFVPLVFFNGLQVRSISYTAGSNTLSFTVPYTTESTDQITVHYSTR